MHRNTPPTAFLPRTPRTRPRIKTRSSPPPVLAAPQLQPDVTDGAAAAPVAAPLPAFHWLDGAVRLALWALSVVLFSTRIDGPLVGESMLALVLFAIIMAGFLLASLPVVARSIRRLAEVEPVSMALVPLAALIPYILISRFYGDVEATQLLTAAILLFLPVAIALINTPRLKRSDVSLGLITAAAPLVLPLTRGESIDAAQVALRLGAFALPVLLLAVTSREQKQRLNFLFVCAVLSLWYSLEFGAFPELSLLPGGDNLGYFHLVALPLFLFILAASDRFDGLGLSFKPSARGLSIVASNLILLAAVVVPIGLVTGFLIPGFSAPTPIEAGASFLAGYLFVALPEEILFRGTIFNYLDDTLRLPQASAVLVSAVVFGSAHLNNPPHVGWYFVLATVAGVFYARTYIMTRNVASSGVVHAAVNWLWSLVFAGGPG